VEFPISIHARALCTVCRDECSTAATVPGDPSTIPNYSTTGQLPGLRGLQQPLWTWRMTTARLDILQWLRLRIFTYFVSFFFFLLVTVRVYICISCVVIWVILATAQIVSVSRQPECEAVETVEDFRSAHCSPGQLRFTSPTIRQQVFVRS
jgi:hypothetical protein